MSAPQHDQIAIATFDDHEDANAAVSDLTANGFHLDQIGIVARDTGAWQAYKNRRQPADDAEEHDKVTAGATAGAAAGAGVGGLWALGIAAGALPAIGPVIAGGLFASILASAATGAAAGGVVGALIGVGIPESEAKEYEADFTHGRTIVTVRAGTRYAEAAGILRAHDARRVNLQTA